MIPEYCEMYEKKLFRKQKISYEGLVFLELGSNIHWRGGSSKEFYESLGVDHTSIDINGKLGSLAHDLDEPLPESFRSQFHVVTNYGILEHVNHQYMGFKNIHDATSRGGMMIHGLPLIGNWPEHCRYRYTKKFCKQLSTLADYELIDLRVVKRGIYRGNQNLIYVAMRKNSDESFISPQEFGALEIEDCGDLSMTGNYDP